ncbi:transforming growth factor-beta receptor-associated protein 1-like [Acanthaster planci]|uniref:Transforming growth factor-beta receptor-associated protein 1-like n=1 Tax=Acanthaster planci TaxID=133434 RepID=A0A8B7YT08_ACAPL|nr:transforming growth factor-beta receptor-associated protein 1-like [Acanthaster planci]
MSVKAFELVPAIERLKLLGEKARTSIECIECCGKNLYIGTSDCFVIHFLVEEKTLPNGKITYSSEKQSHKYLAVKKPIQQLKAASALTRILVLCDNVISLLNMFNLEPIMSGAKIKGVSSFCVNSNPRSSNPFSLEIAVTTRRRQVQVYTVTEDKVVFIKEITLNDIPVNLSTDGYCICIAMTAQYVMVNYSTGEMTDLFPYDADSTSPVVKRVGKEEFLLAGPSALGMFVTSAGISQRPPLKWSENVRGVSYLFPYVVAMDDEFLTVHSVLDQQQKQTIPFQSGKIVGDFEGRIFVASSKEVYALVPIPVEKQIQALLSDQRVEEALTLAKNSKKLGLPKERFHKLYQRVQQQAGFIELARFHYDGAAQLFKEGQLDVRELISIFPNLLPSTSNFNRSSPLLHQFADISSIVRGNKERLLECKTFLAGYLDGIRGGELSFGYREEVDTALLKLYAERDPEKLISLVSSENTCSSKDALEVLQRYGRHHALALLHRYHLDNEKALNIWARLCDGEIKDESFPGLEFVVDFLSRLSDHELVWRYVDWALQKDPELGVKIFTDRSETEPLTERMRPDTVIDYLHAYPKAVTRYLEHLVFTKRLEKEKYHTHLAVLYLDDVLRKDAGTPKTELDLARSKLRHMLEESSLYRVQLILGKVRETEMFAETAILYGKLEEHDKALRILVYKLRDYGAAERYCHINSKGRDRAYRRRLFQILLGVYLDPLEGKKDSLIAPAIALLNSEDADFDASKVLQLIPENWSTALLSQFLTNTVRQSLHATRITKLQRALARTENLNLKAGQIRQQRDPIYLGDDRPCQVCNRPFLEPAFVRYPNGVIVHAQCAWNKAVCPVTGRLFSTKVGAEKR